MENRTTWARKYGVEGAAKEFIRSLNDELDYRNEARQADRLRHNMADLEEVHVPVVHWHLVTGRVLTMELIEGIKISNLEGLAQKGIDRQALANVFIRSMFKQLLVDGFFHADPHPGNMFVEQSGKLTFIDLGMMGLLVEEHRQEMAHLMQALQKSDTEEVPKG